MQDIAQRIFRPVSMPKQFAGAPEGPAILNMALNLIIYFIATIGDWPFPVFFFFTMIFIHLLLIKRYHQEPHQSALMALWWKSTRKVKSIGPRYAQEYNP